MFDDFEFEIEVDGYKGPSAMNHVISAIGDFTLEFNDATIKELEAEIEQTFEDIINNFPKKTGKIIKDIHFENHGNGHLEIWTDNKVVMYIEYGTQGHGPKTAPFLVFKTDDGNWIRTKWVRGIDGHYMIKNALMRLSGRIEQIGGGNK